ncbi:MAG: CRISPR-associated ring nuclease [Thermaerobacter sp.]|nr:CRISPR-associated ring nuclease [Thermaerobacter sp.]
MNVLVAPLGMSPLVVTEAVVALRECLGGPRVNVEQVVLLYSGGGEHPERFIDYGAELLSRELASHLGLRVSLRELPFEDPVTDEDCRAYLRLLREVLEEHRGDDVHLLISGGRKSTSALTGVLAQFYPNVRGGYHVLDAAEGTPAARHHTVEQLEVMPERERAAAMFPPSHQVHLVSLPFAPLADADGLRRYLASPPREAERRSLPWRAEEFFRGVFGTGPLRGRAVRLSEQAVKEYRALGAQDRRRVRGYLGRLAWMELPEEGRPRRYGAFDTDCRVEPQGHWPLRLFLSVPPGRQFIGVHRILTHEAYDRILAQGRLRCADFPARIPLERLTEEVAGVLVGALGTSPMVFTQLYRLLEEAGQRPAAVVLLTSAQERVRRGAGLLQEAFRRHRPAVACEVEELPVEDVASQADCDAFARKLGEVLSRQVGADRPVHLSIAGGRKAMAAVAYYAAQRAGLSEVLHTTIADPAFEQQVIREGSLAALSELSAAQRASRLFLEQYAARWEEFQLIRVPVVPLDA